MEKVFFNEVILHVGFVLCSPVQTIKSSDNKHKMYDLSLLAILSNVGTSAFLKFMTCQEASL